MKVLNTIDFSVGFDSLVEKASIVPGSNDEKELRGLLDLAHDIGNPKAAYAVSYVHDRGEDTVQIDDVVFKSRTLVHQLQSIERVFPYIATCGHEMDQGFTGGEDMIKAFWWDMIKDRMLYAAHEWLCDHIKNQYRLGKIASMQPGSADVSVWPIEQQRDLFDLLGDVETTLGVHLTDSFLMIPNKTVSGIAFPIESDFRSCEVCRRQNCPSRRAAFNEKLWQKIHQK